jgi:hypothetical protein
VHIADRGGTGVIIEFMSEEFKRTWWPDLLATPEKIGSFPLVTCMPLSTILAVFHITHVNLWVLDVEGAELAVLKGVDFGRLSVDVLCIEVSREPGEKEADIDKLLVKAGYKFDATVETNMWYVREGFVPSQRDTARGRGRE